MSCASFDIQVHSKDTRIMKFAVVSIRNIIETENEKLSDRLCLLLVTRLVCVPIGMKKKFLLFWELPASCFS